MPTGRYNETAAIYSDINIAEEDGTNAVLQVPVYNFPHRWDAGYATQNTTKEYHLRIGVQTADGLYFLGTVSIPEGAGLLAVPSVDVIKALVEWPNDGIVLPPGSYLIGQLSQGLEEGDSLVVNLVGGSL